MKKIHWTNRTIVGKPLKIYIAFIITLVILFISYFTYLKPKTIKMKSVTSMVTSHQTRYFEPITEKEIPLQGAKIVHLDLKGAPPKVSYYKTLFPLLSKLGATGILIEYEDMFPYNTSTIKGISALNAYTVEDIRIINELARINNLDVIPLMQTFGHLEFLLKLEEFKELREVSEYPQVICPTHAKTTDLLMEIVDQIVELHPHSNIIHIGADEVYHLGICDRCVNTMNKFNLSKNMLFLEHINAITHRIHQKYPHYKILMWDDEFRSLNLQDLKNGFVNNLIEPVVWKYTKDVYEDLGPTLWDMYSEIFPRIWVASAFKGATGSNQYVSDVTHYVENHNSWRTLMLEYKNRINFQGIILTGWQRYDHFAVLCELLPVALPSLAMSLRVVMGHKDSPLSPPKEVAKILGCAKPYALIGSVFGSPRCSYLGGDILENVLRLQQLNQDYELLLEDSRVKGWFNDYNKKYSFSNPRHIQPVTTSLIRMRGELIQIDVDITAAMNEIYDNYTIDEWKETYIKPFENKINALIEAGDRILSKSSWPRRPLLVYGKNDEL